MGLFGLKEGLLISSIQINVLSTWMAVFSVPQELGAGNMKGVVVWVMEMQRPRGLGLSLKENSVT